MHSIDDEPEQKEFKRTCERAGIPDFTFHNLWDVFATEYYFASGKDIRKLQQALGHKSIKTTERYLATLGLEDTTEVDVISKDLFTDRARILLGMGGSGQNLSATNAGEDILIQ